VSEAYALLNRAAVTQETAQRRDDLEAALAIATRLGHQTGIIRHNLNLSVAVRLAGDLDLAATHALRALAQSMARELGPKGIHVGHIVVDGAIDTPWIRETFPALVESRPADGLLAPDAIAEAYWQLHAQPRNAWTFELDLRPFDERW